MPVRAVSMLVVLVACNAVGETGPRGLVGRLLDNEGTPIANQHVATAEHGVQTGDDGSFEVRWKAPNTVATFRRGGMEWRRALQPDDPPKVDLRLPSVRDGEIACRSETPCNAELRWDHGAGLSSRVDVKCGDGTPVARVPSMPVGKPTVTCSTLLGDLDLLIEDDADRLLITSRPLARPFVITGAKREDGCDAKLFSGKVTQSVGTWGLEPAGDTWAWALCRGRAGVPSPVSPRPAGIQDEEALVALPWAATGVDIRLEPPVPEPRTLTVIRRSESGAPGWQLSIEPADDGTYRLPRLTEGEYRLGLGAPSVLGKLNPPTPEIPGELVFVAGPGEWGVEGGYVGALRLEEDLDEGMLQFEGKPPTLAGDPAP
jgi:hypothetical protein